MLNHVHLFAAPWTIACQSPLSMGFFQQEYWNRLPFRYDLNQIPYDYTVEVTNRFKGLDLVDRVPEELGKEVPNTEQEVVTKISPKKKKARRQHGCLRSLYK